MNVLIVKNISSEGPGTIEEYLAGAHIPYSICDLSKGEPVPPEDEFSHLVVMGGPMAVYEMDRYSYLSHETMLIGRAIAEKKRVLGVCLGAQMVAHALGARVYAGNTKEIGWYEVSITPEGMQDSLMSSLALDGKSAAQVFQWHGDTFDLPRGAVRLASSGPYPNQAFQYAGRVYALQFHIEVTPEVVRGWLKDEKGIDLAGVNSESERIFAAYRTRAMDFYRGFFVS